jgi:hypothetical protein
MTGQEQELPVVRELTSAKSWTACFEHEGEMRLGLSKAPFKAAELITAYDAACNDALAGWRYIRQHHGDLYGVGWDRVEQALDAVLTKARASGCEQ